MQKHYTSKLFFKSFPYKICFTRVCPVRDVNQDAGWTPSSFKSWLTSQGIKNRTYNQVRYRNSKRRALVMNSSVFLSTKEDYDTCVQKYQQWIESVTVPKDDSHVEMLRNNLEIVVRERYFFKKYKYAISFKRRWGDNLDDLNEWMATNFTDESVAKYSTSGWQPRLYLNGEDGLTLLKLTWGEQIGSIRMCCTFDELEMQNPAQ